MSQTNAFQRTLLAQLSEQGWRRVGTSPATENMGWGWSAEVWELASLWRPRGLGVYVGLETATELWRYDDYGYDYGQRRLFRARLAEKRQDLFALQSQAIFEVEQPWPREALPIITALNRYRQQRNDRPDRPLP